MATVSSAGVPTYGIYNEKNAYTYNLSGTITNADRQVMAMSDDLTTAMTMKPAGDGDAIRGQLFSYENRTVEGVVVGTVRHEGLFLFKCAAGYTAPAVGDILVGGGAGTVKKFDASANTIGALVNSLPRVVEVAPNGRTGFVAVRLGA